MVEEIPRCLNGATMRLLGRRHAPRRPLRRIRTPCWTGLAETGQPVPGWIVFGANVFVRAVDCAADLTEAYQRLRDGQEIDGGVRDGGSFGVDLDPSHLEAGASPSRTPARGENRASRASWGCGDWDFGWNAGTRWQL